MPYRATRNFILRRVYALAAEVEAYIEGSVYLGEIGWESENVLRCLASFQKVSLLHHYIYATAAISTSEDFRDSEDFYEEDPDSRQMIEEWLHSYAVEFQSFDEYRAKIDAVMEDTLCFHDWFMANYDGFEVLWDRMTYEVFHLLFANRRLLLKFNQMVARYLSEGRARIPPELLDASGTLRRCGYVPKWLRRAVFYRDQGRCVLCRRDLTGLLGTGTAAHFDHMVPLKQWGTNDPCNIQLLCAECNQRKAGLRAQTATQYEPWWQE